MLLTSVKHKYSFSFHPQSNGASKRTNKTVNQCIRFHAEQNQTGWVKELPLIQFQIMSSINKSTSFSPFQLRFRRSPHVLPPLIPTPPNPSTKYTNAHTIIEEVTTNVATARDNLMLAKITHSYQANSSHSNPISYKIGDKVMLSTSGSVQEKDSLIVGEMLLI